MRLLHAEGFQALSLADFLAFTAGRRQLPRKSVLITFDDGYQSFIQYARPVLKDYGFGATLSRVLRLHWHRGARALLAGPPRPDRARLRRAGPFEIAYQPSTQGGGVTRRRTPSAWRRSWPIPSPCSRKHLGRASDTLATPTATWTTSSCSSSPSTATALPSRCGGSRTPRLCRRSGSAAARSIQR